MHCCGSVSSSTAEVDIKKAPIKGPFSIAWRTVGDRAHRDSQTLCLSGPILGCIFLGQLYGVPVFLSGCLHATWTARDRRSVRDQQRIKRFSVLVLMPLVK